jgi:O-antigen/teichoic acid export membrane protein
LLYGIACAAAMSVLAPLAPRLLGSQFQGTVTMIRLLSLLVVLRCGSLFALNALLGLKRYWLRVSAILSSTLINVGLNLAWIPGSSWRGAAAATLVTEVIFLIATWVALVSAQNRHDRRRDAAGSPPTPGRHRPEVALSNPH